MKIKFKLGRKFVGDNFPCLVVAELSGNHKGKFKRVKNLIIKAKQAGADLIKLQTYTPDTITLNSNRKDFRINKKMDGCCSKSPAFMETIPPNANV